MSELIVYVDREGIQGEATYGKMYVTVPKESYDKIKGRKLMVSSSRMPSYIKYQSSLGAGNVKFTQNSILSDFVSAVNTDGSAIFNCFTLEDIPRKVKVAQKTCIPAGNYPLILVNSPKFGRGCPGIENVPNYSGVRIHAGTSHTWTEGCVLVGYERTNKGARLSSCTTAEVVWWTLLANLVNVGHTLRIIVRFAFQHELADEVVDTPTTTDVQNVNSYLNSGFIGSYSQEYQNIGPAGDCGCYSLSEFDPNAKGDYATQNTKKFFEKISNLVYDTVKNKPRLNSFTNGSITSGSSAIPVTQDGTNIIWSVPTKESLNLLIEEFTYGKRIDIKSKKDEPGTVSFDTSFARSMLFEGGYIYDPIDTAKERNFGLSFEHDEKELEANGISKVRMLTETVAKKIYLEKYWEPNGLSELSNQDVADLMFDILVSCGQDAGINVIKKTVRENYGVQAPDTSTWQDYLTVIKYVQSPKFVGELLEYRLRYHKAFVYAHPEAAKYYDSWVERCDTYRVEIDVPEEQDGGEGRYFSNIFNAIDKWLVDGEPQDSVYRGVNIIYNKSGSVASYIPPSPSVQPRFPGVVDWGKICQMRVDAKTDWATDPETLQMQQWEIVSQCLEKALNQNIVMPLMTSGTSPSGIFSGTVSSSAIWAV